MNATLTTTRKVSLVKLPLFCDFVGADHSGRTIRVMWNESPTVICTRHAAALSN